jgi:hypothetical protein
MVFDLRENTNLVTPIGSFGHMCHHIEMSHVLKH